MKRTLTAILGLVTLTLVAGPAGGATLLALVDTGELYTSDDQGTTWGIRSALPVSDACALIAGTSPSELYLASTTGTVYRSTDAGTNWSAVGSIGASDVVDLTGHANGNLVALTRTGSVYESTDLGVSWSGKGSLTAANMVSVALGANADLYVLTETGEIAESTDDGANWNTVGAISVSDAVEIRRMDTDLVVLTGTGLTYTSSDYGVNWSAVGTVSQVGMSGLTSLGSQLVAVSKEGLVARSADGSTWTWVGAVNQLNVIGLATDDPTATGAPDPPVPARLIMAPLRPNPLLPSSGSLQVQFDLPETDRVSLALYDTQGRKVANRGSEHYPEAGTYTIPWAVSGLGSGVYFLRLSTESGFTATSRIVLLR